VSEELCDLCGLRVPFGDLGEYDEKTGVYACEECVAAESPAEVSRGN
jgi:hypothetical protein